MWLGPGATIQLKSIEISSKIAGVGTFAALRETKLYSMDFQVSYIVEERRLSELSELQVRWPYGSFFRLQASLRLR